MKSVLTKAERRDLQKMMSRLTKAERQEMRDMVSDTYNYAVLIAYTKPEITEILRDGLLRKLERLQALSKLARSRSRKPRRTER